MEIYQNTRNKRGREMHNQSYLNLMEKIRYDLRYWSVDKWHLWGIRINFLSDFFKIRLVIISNVVKCLSLMISSSLVVFPYSKEYYRLATGLSSEVVYSSLKRYCFFSISLSLLSSSKNINFHFISIFLFFFVCYESFIVHYFFLFDEVILIC